jgi:UDP-N-acetylmuramate--alanine ligase
VTAWPGPDDALPAEKLGRVHFVGIGGVGMSCIARIYLARGIPVTGSDVKENREVVSLRALGAQVHLGNRSDNVGDADTVVVSSAIRRATPRSSRPRGVGCPSSRGPQRWRRRWSAAGGWPSPAPTARPRRRRC